MQFLGFNQTKGSSYNLPAHGSGGARARINKSVAKKSVCPSEDGSAGGNAEPSEQKNRGQPRRSARSEQNTTKKFSFPFRRKNPARAYQEKQTFLWCGVASISSRRRGGFLSSVQSRFARSV